MTDSLISRYSAEDADQILPLIESWLFKPMASLNGFQQLHLTKFAVGRVLKALVAQDCRAFKASANGEVRGFALFKMLPWDSARLGVSAGRVDYLVADGSYDEQTEIKKSLLENLLADMESMRLKHLSVRVDASDFSSLHALEEAGFKTVDTILTFAFDLSKQKPSHAKHDFEIRLANSADAEQVAALARESFVYDRFHADPFIRKAHADELHAVWLRDSCLGKAADAVVVAEDDEGLLGFVTCQIQRDTSALGHMVGTIVLIASAKRARVQGVGKALVLAATEWLHEQGCGVIESGTQVRNIPSTRLFLSCGFSIVNASISLRKVCRGEDHGETQILNEARSLC